MKIQENLKKQQAAMTASLEASKARLDELKKEHGGIQEEIKKSQVELAAVKADLSKHAEIKAKHEADHADIKTKVEEKTRALDSLNKEWDSVQYKFRLLQDNYRKEAESNAKRIKLLESDAVQKSTEHRKTLFNILAEHKAAVLSLESAKTELKNTLEKHDEIKKAHEEILNHIMDAKKEHEQTIKKHAEAKRQLEEVNSKLSLVSGAHDELQNSIAKKQSEMDKLHEEHQAKIAEMSDIEKQKELLLAKEKDLARKETLLRERYSSDASKDILAGTSQAKTEYEMLQEQCLPHQEVVTIYRTSQPGRPTYMIRNKV